MWLVQYLFPGVEMTGSTLAGGHCAPNDTKVWRKGVMRIGFFKYLHAFTAIANSSNVAYH